MLAAGLDSAVCGGTPNEKPGCLFANVVVSASGVFGGLPKPKPTGFPILPALPKPPNAFPGDPEPNVKAPLDTVFSGVLKADGPPKRSIPTEGPLLGTLAIVSFSLSLSVPVCLPKILPGKADGVLEKPNGEVVVLEVEPDPD